MAINEHPPKGTILWCDFNHGFLEPEMVKRRPVIVVSPKIHGRVGLCTVVALSTSAPDPIMNYHAQINIRPRLPRNELQSDDVWIKGDMVNTVGFHRLNFIVTRILGGRRQYHYTPLDQEQFKIAQRCVLAGLGLSN
jgi:mRNA interferase MazF